MPGITIRTYQPSDRSGVIALWQTCFPKDPPWNQPEVFIDRKVRQADGFFWVADREGAVVGTVLAGYDGVRGWIYHLAVSPENRRQGIATQLLKTAGGVLKERGCPKINLQVRSSNPGAVDFYKANGFKMDHVTSMGMRIPENP